MFAAAVVSAALLAPAPRVAVTPEVAAKLVTIAFQAARDGDAATLRAYLAAGRPADAVSPRGDTLLTVAAYAGHPACVELLLKTPGVKVDARNKMGLTALSAAAYKGHAGIIKSLLAAKADPNAASPSGQTALMFAALAGKAEVVTLLLSAGADRHAKDKAGNTAKSLAEGQGADAVAKLLDAAK